MKKPDMMVKSIRLKRSKNLNEKLDPHQDSSFKDMSPQHHMVDDDEDFKSMSMSPQDMAKKIRLKMAGGGLVEPKDTDEVFSDTFENIDTHLSEGGEVEDDMESAEDHKARKKKRLQMIMASED